MWKCQQLLLLVGPVLIKVHCVSLGRELGSNQIAAERRAVRAEFHLLACLDCTQLTRAGQMLQIVPITLDLHAAGREFPQSKGDGAVVLKY